MEKEPELQIGVSHPEETSFTFCPVLGIPPMFSAQDSVASHRYIFNKVVSLERERVWVSVLYADIIT